MSERAAGQLARRIERYWRRRGRRVRVWLEPSTAIEHDGGAYVLRSDMIDGLPRARERSVARRGDACSSTTEAADGATGA